MRNKIKSVSGLISYIAENSSWSLSTVRAIVNALGRPCFKQLSGTLSDVANHGANGGFCGFIYHRETVAFYKKHRRDITQNLEQLASDMGEDIISMVQGFGVFRYDKEKPDAAEIGQAIWGCLLKDELTQLYNVFSWFCLEEIARVWLRYLEENPGNAAELST